MRRGRPQTGRAWCCGLHGRTLKSRRSQRYVGGEHGHDQGRVRTTKLLGEKHAPNVPQELRTPRVHGQSSPFLVRHGGRSSPHRCRRVHVVGEGVGVRTVRNTTFYVSIAISAELLMHGPPRDRGKSTPLFDLHQRRAKTLPAGASHVVCHQIQRPKSSQSLHPKMPSYIIGLGFSRVGTRRLTIYIIVVRCVLASSPKKEITTKPQKLAGGAPRSYRMRMTGKIKCRVCDAATLTPPPRR